MDNRQIAEFRPIIDSSKTVLALLGFIESLISFRVEPTTHVSTARVEFYHFLGVVRFGRNPMPAEEVVFLDDNVVRQNQYARPVVWFAGKSKVMVYCTTKVMEVAGSLPTRRPYKAWELG
jgi:hypothetical protein